VDPFIKAYKELITSGIMCSPRGQNVLEIEDFSMDLHPINDRFSDFGPRKMNLDYAKFEAAWYIRGDRYETDTICDKAQMWTNIIDVDGGINSNYGQYIFGNENQFDWVVSQLSEDRDSRRAVMCLLNSGHLRDSNPDVVCTYSIAFRIRDNKLNMSIHMRSWDAIWGMTNDVFCFSVIYEMVYAQLLRTIPDLQVGNYHHAADSFHVYERHFDMIKQLAKGDDRTERINCPRILGHKEVSYLRRRKSNDLIPSDYKFSQWLLSE
jgi:thymidylate synthase